MHIRGLIITSSTGSIPLSSSNLSLRYHTNTITVIIHCAISCCLIVFHIKSSNFPNSIIRTILDSNVVTKFKLSTSGKIVIPIIVSIFAQESINVTYTTPSTNTYSSITSIRVVISTDDLVYLVTHTVNCTLQTVHNSRTRYIACRVHLTVAYR